jgi:hypothetical protein
MFITPVKISTSTYRTISTLISFRNLFLVKKLVKLINFPIRKYLHKSSLSYKKKIFKICRKSQTKLKNHHFKEKNQRKRKINN